MPFAALQNESVPANSEQRTGLVFAWLLGGLFASIYALLGIIRFRIYRASVDDGIFTQSIASAANDFHNQSESIGHFAVHFSPILAALVPLLWLTHSTIALIVVQAVACGLTIPAIYLIARRRLPPYPACAIALITALYPALGGIAFTDFHENAFAPAAAAWLLWAIDMRKMPAAAIFAALCLSIKEDQALIVAFLGIVGTIAFAMQHERKWAAFCAITAMVSIALYATYMLIIQPMAGNGAPYFTIGEYYTSVPIGTLLGSLFAAPKLGYAFALLLPLLGICLLSRSFILALPGLAECMLSQLPLPHTIGQHYPATWLPYVMVAFALGVAVLWQRAPRATTYALGLCIAIGIYTNIWASPNAWWYNLGPYTQEDAQLDALQKTFAPDQDIAVPYQMYAHLGFDPNATFKFTPPPTAILIDRRFAAKDYDDQAKQYLAQHPEYKRTYSNNQIELYELAK